MDEHEQCKQEAAEAASRISALEAQVARLREALAFYAKSYDFGAKARVACALRARAAMLEDGRDG